MFNKRWEVEPIYGHRKLPVYLLIETGFNNKGASIEIEKEIQPLLQSLGDDTQGNDSVSLNVLTFSENTLINHLKYYSDVLEESNGVGNLFTYLKQDMETNICSRTKGDRKGDWLPIVIILTFTPYSQKIIKDIEQVWKSSSKDITPSILLIGNYFNKMNKDNDFCLSPSLMINIEQGAYAIHQFFTYLSVALIKAVKPGSVRDYPASSFRKTICQFSSLSIVEE
ncbi:hypothetical protein QA612_12720 [Evansella sp. AB-P1]|uniref:hypothetical protein n=1 Tax=Evansella sp. AB-P1 TaxID=3037653 RepID=UPI00241C3EBA|nr:hypothetical protein [Evansella sp. AB-P1]MDG5788346.1 hypothetical protein [Evansella sp. AB-P1]